MYLNYHLAITKEEYLQRQYPLQTDLNIEEIAPDIKTFIDLLKRVGGPWGWDRRPKYFADIESLKTRIYDKDSHLFLLNHFSEVTGYCFATKRADLTATFNRHAIAEIENFGLFPEHTGKGYGKTFLPLVFNRLFKENDVVYLASRSTNHKKVISFYESLGMKLIETEEMEDDLRPDPPDLIL